MEQKTINDALLDACQGRLLTKVNRCLSNGADPNTAGALELAICGCPEIVDVLLSAGANPNVVATGCRAYDRMIGGRGNYRASLGPSGQGGRYLRNVSGGTILMAAMSVGISVPPELTDEDYKPGAAWKPHTFVQTGKQPEIAKMLLSAGADPNMAAEGDMATESGETPLMRAVSVAYDNAQFVKMLLSAGANPNAKTEGGETALMRAVRIEEAQVVQLLLSAGVDPNAATKNGGTVLMMAAQKGHAEIVRALLSAGAKPDAVNDGWDTALDIAQKGDNSEVVSILKAAGAGK